MHSRKSDSKRRRVHADCPRGTRQKRHSARVDAYSEKEPNFFVKEKTWAGKDCERECTSRRDCGGGDGVGTYWVESWGLAGENQGGFVAVVRQDSMCTYVCL